MGENEKPQNPGQRRFRLPRSCPSRLSRQEKHPCAEAKGAMCWLRGTGKARERAAGASGRGKMLGEQVRPPKPCHLVPAPQQQKHVQTVPPSKPPDVQLARGGGVGTKSICVASAGLSNVTWSSGLAPVPWDSLGTSIYDTDVNAGGEPIPFEPRFPRATDSNQLYRYPLGTALRAHGVTCTHLRVR